MDSLEADALQSFSAFAERLNFTTAARHLHISQPALHVKIRKLSRALDETLYERSGRHLVLTPAGEELARFAQDSKQRAERFLSELKGTGDQPLVLACGRGAFLNVVDAGIASELKRGTKLQFIIDNTAEAAGMIERGKADVAVGVFTSVSSKVAAVPLATYTQNLVVPRKHEWATRSSLNIRDLDGLSLAVPTSTFPQRRQLDAVLSEAGIKWLPAVEAEGWDLLMHLAKLGVAPAIVNSCVRAPTGLMSIPITGLPPVEYSAMTRRGAKPAVTELVERLQQNVR